ncbi:IS630 family transposase [Rhizobium sp. P40RR-XXII]|nr:IS630 family transposase [Rhizobium sp. P40RR-XXII]
MSIKVCHHASFSLNDVHAAPRVFCHYTHPIALTFYLRERQPPTCFTRHGTTTLFAALDIANGQVLTRCRARHRHQEFLGFLKHIEANVRPDLDAHLVADNYAAHKHPKVRAWLAARPRFHIHYTPTYASWLNQVERWFALPTERQIRRASFVSAKLLI